MSGFKLGEIVSIPMTNEERKKWDAIDWSNVPYVKPWGEKK